MTTPTDPSDTLAVAVLDLIDAGKLDRYLIRLQAAMWARMRTEEWQHGSGR